jgi:putative addiction module killer protein
MIQRREYVDRLGRNPFRRWRDDLDAVAVARIATALDRLLQGNVSQVKSVGSGVSELKVDFGPGYRVYFGWDGAKLIILLGGGTKKRQQQDIAQALDSWADYKSRKPRGA